MKGTKLVFVLLFVVMAVMSISLVAFAADRPVIKVASNVNLPLRLFWEGTKVVGYEADVVREALDIAGYDVEFIDVAFAGIIPGLLSEKWDLGCSSIYITIERESQMDFTEPFNEGFDAAVAPVDGDIQTLADFKGRVIGTETGTSQAAWLYGLQDEFGPFEIRGYDDRETQYMDLENGRIQALTTGYNTAVLYLADKPDFHIIDVSDNNSMIGCAVRPDSPLKAEFDEALRQMKKDGRTSELYEKYFEQSVPEGSAIALIFEEPYVPSK